MSEVEKIMIELSKVAAELNLSIQQVTNVISEISILAKDLEEEIENGKV